MPSKGSPRVTIRLPQKVFESIKEMADSRNKAKPAEKPWDMTDWIMVAIAEKMAKTYRGRGEVVLMHLDQPDDNKPHEVEIVSVKQKPVKCVACGSDYRDKCNCE